MIRCSWLGRCRGVVRGSSRGLGATIWLTPPRRCLWTAFGSEASDGLRAYFERALAVNPPHVVRKLEHTETRFGAPSAAARVGRCRTPESTRILWPSTRPAEAAFLHLLFAESR